MDEEMISKKELLERYGISYGALYRWKRMGLEKARKIGYNHDEDGRRSVSFLQSS